MNKKRLKAFNQNPKVKALVNKLILDRGTLTRQQAYGAPAESILNDTSDKVTQNIEDYNNILQLLPDTELAMQILVSSILSPNDLINVELDFKTTLKKVDSELTGQLIEIIKRFFTEEYDLKSILPTILEEALFTKGSYPLLVLPEDTIDSIINSDDCTGIESFAGVLVNNKMEGGIGVLGSPKEPKSEWSLENYGKPVSVPECDLSITGLKDSTLLTVTDNISTLKMPLIHEQLRKNALSNTYGLRYNKTPSLESVNSKGKEVNDVDVKRLFYKNKNYRTQSFLMVNRTEARTGEPLIMKLSSECCIPAHKPGAPEDHLGYFVLLDEHSNPLTKAKEANYYRDLSSKMNNGSAVSELLGTAANSIYGLDNNGNKGNLELDEVVGIYTNIVEKDLITRLKNGIYGNDIELADVTDVYRIMLSRALSQMKTQILYVPKELVTYIAFDYSSNGVGKSLLEDNKILASIRAMLLFSNTMAAIKNSTSKTALKIQLDPNDSSPTNTVEYLVHTFFKNRKSSYPLTASSPVDIIDFLQTAGVDIQVTGNAAYPETTVDVEDYSTSKVEIDSTLEEDIKKKYFMSLGLSPEIIDMSSEVEFATSIVSSNLLLSKRVMRYQDVLLYKLREFVMTYVNSSSRIWSELLTVLEENEDLVKGAELEFNSDEELLGLFINSINVFLPRPDSAKLENQQEAFSVYTDFLEEAIDAYLDDDMFDVEEGESIAEQITAFRSLIINYFKREWLRSNNVLPELMDIINSNGKGEPIMNIGEIHTKHIESLKKSVATLLTPEEEEGDTEEEQV